MVIVNIVLFVSLLLDLLWRIGTIMVWNEKTKNRLHKHSLRYRSMNRVDMNMNVPPRVQNLSDGVSRNQYQA